MKKVLLLTLTAILVSSGIAIYYFVTNSEPAGILKYIPADARSVIVIDVKGLTTKLAVDEISSSKKSSGRLMEMLPDSLKEIDFLNSGLNLFNNAAVFTSETQEGVDAYALLPVADYKQLHQFVDSLKLNLKLKIEKSGNATLLYSEQYRVLAAFNRQIFIATRTRKPEVEKEKQLILGYLNVKPENSFGSDSLFIAKLSKNQDVFLFSRSYNSVKGQFASIYNDNIESSNHWILFEDGKVKISSDIEHKKGAVLNEFFSKQESNIQKINHGDSAGVSILLNVKPELFFSMLKGISSVKFNFNKMPIIKTWNGTAYLVFNKAKEVTTEYVSYEYDDDFNKVEVKKVVKSKVVDFQANLGIDEGKHDSVLRANKIPKAGKDSLLYSGSSIVVNSTDNGYLCYNKNVQKPILIPSNSDENLAVNLNKPVFNEILRDLNLVNDSNIFYKLSFNKLALSLNNEKSIKSDISISFEEENKNSFFILMEQLIEFTK